MSSNQVLIVDPSSLLNSQSIQIIHKHPDFSHKIRSDLDPYELIAFSYPATLANKIIPFLEPQTSPVLATARTRSPKRQKTASPTRRTRRTINTDTDPDVQVNAKTTSPRRPSPSKTSTIENATITTSTTQPLTSLPTPHLTPTRQLTPPLSSKFTPATVNTAYTSRTISPGGTIFSPLKPLPLLWPPTHPNPSQTSKNDLSNIPPSAFFTPAKPLASTMTKEIATKSTAATTTTTQKSNRSRNPRPLTHFDYTPTSLDHRPPLPTLCLRHDLPTQGLRDVFEWCLVSIEVETIVDLNRWMVKFRDTARVRAIVEVSRSLGLKRMVDVAENLLERMERGFGTVNSAT